MRIPSFRGSLLMGELTWEKPNFCRDWWNCSLLWEFRYSRSRYSGFRLYVEKKTITYPWHSFTWSLKKKLVKIHSWISINPLISIPSVSKLLANLGDFRNFNSFLKKCNLPQICGISTNLWDINLSQICGTSTNLWTIH